MTFLHPSEFRGTNYTPSISRGFSASLGLIPWVDLQGHPTNRGGFFDPLHCTQEISRIAAGGLNSIRMVGCFSGWLADADAYMASLAQLAAACVQHGVSITYIFWNSTPWGASFFPLGTVYAQGFPPPGRNPLLIQMMFDTAEDFSRLNTPITDEENLTQHQEPGPDEALWGDPQIPWLWRGPAEWDPRFVRLIDAYVSAICGFFTTDAMGSTAIASFDLYNEPDAIWESPSGVFPYRVGPVTEFLKATFKAVKFRAPQIPCTVGWAGLNSSVVPNHNAFIEALGVDQDYYSFHSYADPAGFQNAVRNVVLPLLPRRDIPVVCSEFWEALFRDHLKEFLTTLRTAGFGGQMWGYLQHNAYRFQPGRPVDFDGVLVPTPARLIRQGAPIPAFPPASGSDESAALIWRMA